MVTMAKLYINQMKTHNSASEGQDKTVIWQCSERNNNKKQMILLSDHLKDYNSCISIKYEEL